MKILSWNINGLRAALAKHALDWVWEQEPDVVCLQEIKVHPSQLKEEHNHFPGYEVIWNPAQKLGYSGVRDWSLCTIKTCSTSLSRHVSSNM